MKKAAILLADGFEEIEAIVPYDLLKEAGIETSLVSVQNQPTVTGTNGLEVKADANLDGFDFASQDALVVPGGAGYEILKANPVVIEQIKAFAANPEKVLGAICAGSSILGDLGLYKGKDYTCVPGLNGAFGGHFEKKHAVVDGNIVTGISAGGAFEFAFDLVEKLAGKKEKDKLEKQTCYKL